MGTRRRRIVAGVAAAGSVTALAMIVLVSTSTHVASSSSSPGREQVAAAVVAPVDPLSKAIAALQETLRREPTNDQAWAELGQAYLQQARLTADPSYYAKATTALATSLRLLPRGNTAALVGQATLESGQHEFSRALALANQAISLNPYSASAYAIKTDALTELGQYDQARVAAQKLLDLRPGVDSFARASYQYELRGQVTQAQFAMKAAADGTIVPADKAFAHHYLGELAFNHGDTAAALREDETALANDPNYVPAIAGRARTLAAMGQLPAALVGYRDAVQRQPQPAYVVALAELLESDGQHAAATNEYLVVRATEQLFAAQGANVDLELALFEADHGTPAEALRYAASAYAARPASIFVQDAYAWALHKAGRDAEALPIARRAASLGYESASLRFHLATIEASLGDRVAARRNLTAALALCQQFNPIQAPAARRLLATLG